MLWLPPVPRMASGLCGAGTNNGRVAFVPIVIFLVAVVFLLVLLFFIWLFSKEQMGGYRTISGA